MAGTTETVHTYGWYMRKYIEETKARGATPILLTPTIRNLWKDGEIERDMGYASFIRQIAAQEHIEVADMASLEAEELQKLGPEQTALLFPKEHTHTSSAGAARNAVYVAEALRRIHSPLAAYLLPEANYVRARGSAEPLPRNR